MAIDLCSETTSPRISFSHDLGQTDLLPLDPHSKSRLDSTLLDSNSDFEFGILEHESSSADELFAGGVILPIQIRERTATPKRAHDCLTQPLLSLPPRPTPSSASGSSKKESLKEKRAANSESEEKPQFKSFWSFKRSTSLNGDNGSKKSLLCSLPLLSRSNSTGSVPNQKRATVSSSRDAMKQNSHKLPSIPMAKSASTTTSFYKSHMQQRVQLKKNYYAGSYGHGGRISSVLNVPPPYISKSTANLFGLGSFFSNGKDKKNKR